jgi:molybdenum cofactor guanylyltransferase
MNEQRPQGLKAYILAGGKSSRFGSDKALIEIEGKPLIKRIADGLLKRVDRVTVVAECKNKYEPLGLETIGDARPGLGPMGGLLTALIHNQSSQECANAGLPLPKVSSAAPWLLLCGCDLLYIKDEWLDSLCAHCTEAAMVVAFKARYWEPLFALYRATLGERAIAYLQEGKSSLWGFIETLPNVAVIMPDGSLPQINSLDDLSCH